MTRILICLAVLTLAGCAATPKPEPTIVTKTVDVPVPVACTVDPGPAPRYVDSDGALLAAPDLFRRVQLLVAGRLQRIGREAELLAALGACAGKPPGT